MNSRRTHQTYSENNSGCSRIINLIRKPVEMYGKIASAGSLSVTRKESDAPDRKVACDGVLFKDLLMDDVSMIGY